MKNSFHLTITLQVINDARYKKCRRFIVVSILSTLKNQKSWWYYSCNSVKIKDRVGMNGYLRLQITSHQLNQQLKNMVVVYGISNSDILGGKHNSHGIPQTFYTYLISVYVNQAIGVRDKIVKIIPLTEGYSKTCERSSVYG